MEFGSYEHQVVDKISCENPMADDKNTRIEQANFKAVLENINQGVCLFDGQHRLVLCNQMYIDIYALPNESVKPGTQLKDLLEARIQLGNYPEMKPDEYIRRRMKVVTDQVSHTEIQHMHNGQVITVGHRPLADGGWITTHEDITEHYALQKDIRHLAYHDHLTGLPNRVQFKEKIDHALADGKKMQSFALLFVDLDGFKQVNDQYGHSAGDKLLVAASRRLRNCIRSSDMAARMGGDEFAVIQISTIVPKDAKTLAKRIISELDKPFDIDGNKFKISASIGITFAADRIVTFDNLLIEADAAMYQSKRDGGGRYVLFAADLPVAAHIFPTQQPPHH